jgi:hypothetical protein
MLYQRADRDNLPSSTNDCLLDGTLNSFSAKMEFENFRPVFNIFVNIKTKMQWTIGNSYLL